MNNEIEVFKALKFNTTKKYYYYSVPTTVRRSGEYKISNKKAKYLLDKYKNESKI